MIDNAPISDREYEEELLGYFLVALNALASKYECQEMDLGGELSESARKAMLGAISYLRKLVVMREDERDSLRTRKVSRRLYQFLIAEEPTGRMTIQEMVNWYNAQLPTDKRLHGQGVDRNRTVQRRTDEPQQLQRPLGKLVYVSDMDKDWLT